MAPLQPGLTACAPIATGRQFRSESTPRAPADGLRDGENVGVTPDEILREMARTYQTLDRWRSLLADGVVLAHGSELQRQDDEWPFIPSSTIALAGLATAREHLHAIRLLVATRQLFPSATSTLARAALVGAAQTVWTLVPDPHEERMRRSASLAREDYRHHISYAQFAINGATAVELHSLADQELEHLSVRFGEVSTLAAKYGGAIRINITDDVLPAAVKATSIEVEFQDQVQLRWRAMSGSAHSLLWPQFGQSGTAVGAADERGVGQVVVRGDVERLGVDYFSAYHVAVQGWSLFARRAGRPDLIVGE